jgi:Ca2+-binding EF-hand superfamily protein
MLAAPNVLSGSRAVPPASSSLWWYSSSAAARPSHRHNSLRCSVFAEQQELATQLKTGTMSQDRVQELKEQFSKFDIDGNGVIDKTELRSLLEAVTGGEQPTTAQGWVVDAIVDSVMASFDSEGNNTICFDDFTRLMQDSLLLDGKLKEYQNAFQLVDTSGNGTLGGSEVRALFEELGHPLTDQKLFDVMERFDAAGTGQLGFNDFLDLFRTDLLEAQEVLDYIQLRASDAALPERRETSLIEWMPGEVMLIFSGEEFKALSGAHPRRVVVLEASFTWCRPCKGFQKSFEKFAEHYPETIFLKLYGNSNANTKAIFQRLQVPMTPHFTFWRGGAMLGQHSGANKGKMMESLQKYLQEWDNPIAGANKFKQQVWSAKLLGGGTG